MNRTVTTKEPGKFYWWAQSAPADVLKRRGDTAKVTDTLHMLRDSTASLHYFKLLFEVKFEFGGVLYNMPPKVYQHRETIGEPISYIASNDLILHTTRPALNDNDDDKGGRKLHRTYLKLENIIYTCMDSFFNYSNKDAIILSDKVADNIDKNRIYRAIGFHVKGDVETTHQADVNNKKALFVNNHRVKPKDRTIGYIVYSPLVNNDEYPNNTPNLLSVFSLNGAMTLLWAYLVIRDHYKLIKEIIFSNEHRIIVAEFPTDILQSNQIIPLETFFIKQKAIPSDFSFADSIKSEIKIDVSF